MDAKIPVTQLTLPHDTRRFFLKQFGFSADVDANQDNGYITFIQGQSVIVMILLLVADVDAVFQQAVAAGALVSHRLSSTTRLNISPASPVLVTMIV